MNFIKLHTPDEQPIWINLHLVEILNLKKSTSDGSRSTVLTLTDGDYVEVTETPEEIFELALHKSCCSSSSSCSGLPSLPSSSSSPDSPSAE